jgi:hypothetical protein
MGVCGAPWSYMIPPTKQVQAHGKQCLAKTATQQANLRGWMGQLQPRELNKSDMVVMFVVVFRSCKYARNLACSASSVPI